MSDTPISVGMITFDCADPRALANFWSQATGAPIIQDHEGYFVMLGATPALGFQKVDEPTPGKNRIHLDASGGDRRGQVERLVALGAVEHDSHEIAGFGWTVMEDPAGNLFCVGDPRQ